MPTELRHVLFRPAEVVQAIRQYHRRLGLTLPAGTVQSCGPEYADEGQEVRFRLTIIPDRVQGKRFVTGQTGTPEEMVIEGPALAAALILYCRDRHIPLPAGANKSLQIFAPDRLCLVSTMNPWGSALTQAVSI
jgi:hypothetical protein